MINTNEFEILRSDVPTRSGNLYPESVCKQIVEAINNKQYPVLDNLYFKGDDFDGEMIGRTESAEYCNNAVIVKVSLSENVEFDYLAPAGIAMAYDKWSSNVSITDYELKCIQVGRDHDGARRSCA